MTEVKSMLFMHVSHCGKGNEQLKDQGNKKTEHGNSAGVELNPLYPSNQDVLPLPKFQELFVSVTSELKDPDSVTVSPSLSSTNQKLQSVKPSIVRRKLGHNYRKNTQCSYLDRDVMDTPVRPGHYTPQFRSEVVKVAKQDSVKAATKQFSMADSTVRFWLNRESEQSKRYSIARSGSECGKFEGMKKRKQSCYSPQFKAQVLEFSARNSRVTTQNIFDVPESTLSEWIVKAKKLEGYIIDDPEGGDRLTSSDVRKTQCNESYCSGLTVKKWPLVSSQVDSSMIYDISSRCPDYVEEARESSVIKEPSFEEQVIAESVPATPASKVSCYPVNFRANAVNFGELHGWKAAAKKFGVAVESVGLWAKRLGKSKYKRLDAETKDAVVKYGVEHNSWVVAAEKFCLSPYTVYSWGKKAGYKLQRKYTSRTVAPILERSPEPGVEHIRSAEDSGAVPSSEPNGEMTDKSAVEDNNNKDILKTIRVKAVNLDITTWTVQEGGGGDAGLGDSRSTSVVFTKEMIHRVVVFSEEHGLKAAARKFGVANHLVLKWSKKLKLGSSIRDKSSQQLENPQMMMPRVKKKNPKYINDLQNYSLNYVTKEGNEELRKFKCSLCTKCYKSKRHLKDHYSGFHYKEKFYLEYGKENSNSTVTCKLCGKISTDKSKFGTHVGSVHQKLSEEIINSSKYESGNPLTALQSPPVGLSRSADGPDNDKCEACGAVLAADETLLEHVVSIHLTMEGLCDICGEDSKDFVDHFKIHLKGCKNPADLPMALVKTEFIVKPDDNHNLINATAITAVKTEVNDENDGRLVLNPFYISG